jgi:hypothetical protein
MLTPKYEIYELENGYVLVEVDNDELIAVFIEDMEELCDYLMADKSVDDLISGKENE